MLRVKYFLNKFILVRKKNASILKLGSFKDKVDNDRLSPLLNEAERNDSYIDSPHDENFNTFLKTDFNNRPDNKSDKFTIYPIIEEEKSECESDADTENVKFKQRNTFVAFKANHRKEIKNTSINSEKDNNRRFTTASPSYE